MKVRISASRTPRRLPYCALLRALWRVNARALATVTAIIDGTGSIGAAVGPMLTGWISAHTDDWNNVFFMLYAADLVAGLLLMKLVMKEIRAM